MNCLQSVKNELYSYERELQRKKALLGKGIDHLILPRIKWLENEIETLKLFLR